MQGMAESLSLAGALVLAADPDLLQIVALSLYVSLSATVIALCLGLPLGALLAIGKFRGRGGVIVAVILCVPDWNYFNQHPVKWLPIDEDHPDWETKYKPQMEAKGGAKGRKQESKKKR